MIEAEAKLQREDRKELWRQTVRVGKEHRRGVRRRQPIDRGQEGGGVGRDHGGRYHESVRGVGWRQDQQAVKKERRLEVLLGHEL